MKKLYLIWQDPKTRRWFPVGRLTYNDKVYCFMYTKGAKKASNFIPLGRMSNLEVPYESSELFPLFANRLLSKTRPEYEKFLHWLNLYDSDSNDNPIVLLGRSGGIRETDSMEVFLCPQKDKDGKYHVSFFSRGIRYLPKHALEVINSLNPNDQLFIMSDLQNPSDEFAIALRTGEPVTIVGYCPSYLAEDFHSLLKECGPNSLKITVERVNSDAPTQLRLLCSMIAPWPNNFEPCDGELFEVLPERVL